MSTATITPMSITPMIIMVTTMVITAMIITIIITARGRVFIPDKTCTSGRGRREPTRRA